jgi:hypothetical protein
MSLEPRPLKLPSKLCLFNVLVRLDFRLHAVLHRSRIINQRRSRRVEDRVQLDTLLRTTRNYAQVSAHDSGNVPGRRFATVRQVI